LGNYLTAADQGGDAIVRFGSAADGSGSIVTVLQGPGPGLDTPIAQGAIWPT
jgi:hypothetical protein